MTDILTLTGVSDDPQVGRIATDLVLNLAGGGRRVCLLALAGNADSATGLPGWSDIVTLEDSLRGEREPSLLQLAEGCELLIGSRDPRWLASLSADDLQTLAGRLEGLDGYDLVVLHTGPGSDQNTLAFALSSPLLLLAITPAADSLSAAYSLLKILYAEQYPGHAGIVVSRSGPEAGRQTWEKLRGIAAFHLEMPLSLAATVASREAGEEEGYTAGVAQLAESVLQQRDEQAYRDMTDFTHALLRAAGVLPEPDGDTPLTPVFSETPADRDLHNQLELLSGQIDALISEVGRLREPDGSPRPQRPPEVPDCDTACMASMASGSQRVTVDGESFTVYHLQRSDGTRLRYACQSIDDDLEEPEPQSHLH